MDRVASTLGIIPRVIGIVVSTGFGLFWLTLGLGIKASGVAPPADWFAPLFFGVLALCAALFGVIRLVMGLRAPLPRSERAADGSETLTFDADAAIERYLAQKRSAAEPLAVETVSHAARQVFGRKHTDAA